MFHVLETLTEQHQREKNRWSSYLVCFFAHVRNPVKKKEDRVSIVTKLFPVSASRYAPYWERDSAKTELECALSNRWKHPSTDKCSPGFSNTSRANATSDTQSFIDSYRRPFIFKNDPFRHTVGCLTMAPPIPSGVRRAGGSVMPKINPGRETCIQKILWHPQVGCGPISGLVGG